MAGSVRLGHLFGIPLAIHYTLAHCRRTGYCHALPDGIPFRSTRPFTPCVLAGRRRRQRPLLQLGGST